jgi:hypothetical protein
MTTNGKSPTRVCVVNFDTEKVVNDRLVKPPSPIISRGKADSHFSRTDLRSRLFGCSANKDACRRTDAFPHTENAIDDLTGHSLESDLISLNFRTYTASTRH